MNSSLATFSTHSWAVSFLELWLAVIALLVILGAIGAPLVMLSFSDRGKPDPGLWVASGAALIAAICGGTSLLGLSVFASSWLICLIVGAATTLLVAYRRNFRYRSTPSLTALALAIGEALIPVTIVVFVSAVLLYKNPGNRFGDAYGSTDLFEYWSGANYLVHHGSTVGEFTNQPGFEAARNIVLLALRPGTLTLLSFLGLVTGTGAGYMFIPLMVAITAALPLAGFRLMRNDTDYFMGCLLPLVIAVTPFLYFCLIYSYLGQAVGVMLSVFAFLAWADLVKMEITRWRVTIFVAVLLFAAAISYDAETVVLFIAAFAFAGLTLLMNPRKNMMLTLFAGFRSKYLYVIGCFAILIVPIIPRLVASLRLFSNMRPLPGWEWPRLPQGFDFAGLSVPWNVSAGDYAVQWLSAPINDWLVAFGWILVILVCARCAWGSGYSKAMLALLCAQCVVTFRALVFSLDGIVNASHAVWKTASLYAWLVPAMLVSTALHPGDGEDGIGYKLWKSLLLGSVCFGMMCSLILSPGRKPWFNLIDVEQLMKESGSPPLLAIGVFPEQPSLAHKFLAPLKFDTGKNFKLWGEERAFSGSTDIIFAAGNMTEASAVSAAGLYRRGAPPEGIDLRQSSGEAWILKGFYGWEANSYRWVQRDASVVLGEPKSSLIVVASTQMPFINAHNHLTAASVPIDVFVDGIPCGTFNVSDNATRSEIRIPASLLEKHSKAVEVRFVAHYDYKAGGDASQDPRMIAWGATKIGFE